MVGEVVAEVAEHLRQEHDIDMPDAEAIVMGDLKEDRLDPKVGTITRRLREAPGIADDQGVEPPEHADPATTLRRR